MAKFRKRPVIIDAEQFTGATVLMGMCRSDARECSPNAGRWHVHTLEGTSYEVKRGDWIITGVKGERYPCKPDIFRETYEAVEEVPHDA